MTTIVIRPSSGWRGLDLRGLWAYRELLYFLVWRDVKVRYKQTVIGAGWAVLRPFLTMVVFTIFFGRLAGLPSDGLPYPVFYFGALVPWTYFSGALTSATGSIVEHQLVITRVYFPRVLLPLSSVVSNLIDLAVASIVLLGMAIAYNTGVSPRLLLLPAFVALGLATALGAGLWLSALNAVYRDIRYATPFLLQLWLFASPVVYPVSLVPERWHWLYGLNPMASVVEGFRWTLTSGSELPLNILIASVGAAALVVVSGAAYFRRMESTIVDLV